MIDLNDERWEMLKDLDWLLDNNEDDLKSYMTRMKSIRAKWFPKDAK